MVFPVVMYGCERSTIKKAKYQRTDALRVPWTARGSKQSILKEINPKYLLEGLMLKLKFQYFGHLMQRADSLEKTLILGKIEGRRRGQQRMRWFYGIINSMKDGLTQWTRVWANSGRQWRTGKPGVLQSMGSQRAGHDWVTKLNKHPEEISASSVTHRSPSPHNFLAILNSHKIYSFTWGGNYNLGFHKIMGLEQLRERTVQVTLHSHRPQSHRERWSPSSGDAWNLTPGSKPNSESLSPLLLHFTVSWQHHLQSRMPGAVIQPW